MKSEKWDSRGFIIISAIGWIAVGLFVYFCIIKPLSTARSNTQSTYDKLCSIYQDIPSDESDSYYEAFNDGLKYAKQNFVEFCRVNDLGFDYYYEGLLEGYNNGYTDAKKNQPRKYHYGE